MAWRTSEEDVREIIATDSDVAIAPFIEMASALTDYVSSQDSANENVLNDTLLTAIEKNLAAFFYEARDQAYAEKRTGDASAKFQGTTGKLLEDDKWGQRALVLDISGTLRRLQAGSPRARIKWLGLPPSEQTEYEDRD